MSLAQDAIYKILSLKPNAFKSAQSIQDDIRCARPRADIPKNLQKLCDISVQYVNDRQVITLQKKNSRPTKTLLYIHGGGYVHDLVSAHWQMICAMIKRSDMKVVVPIYRLAPYATIDSELPFMLTVYDTLCDGEVFVAGDSAGGNFSLVLSIELRNQNKKLPKSVFLFSPWVDATMTNPQIDDIAKNDPMLAVAGIDWCAKAWAGERELDDVKLSPINDHLNDLPPLHIYHGTYDILFADVKKFADKAKSSNTPCQLHIFDKAFHVFMGAIVTPEAGQVFEDVAKVINQHA